MILFFRSKITPLNSYATENVHILSIFIETQSTDSGIGKHHGVQYLRIVFFFFLNKLFPSYPTLTQTQTQNDILL